MENNEASAQAVIIEPPIGTFFVSGETLSLEEETITH